jgi:hypothetical protein
MTSYTTPHPYTYLRHPEEGPRHWVLQIFNNHHHPWGAKDDTALLQASLTARQLQALCVTFQWPESEAEEIVRCTLFNPYRDSDYATEEGDKINAAMKHWMVGDRITMRWKTSDGKDREWSTVMDRTDYEIWRVHVGRYNRWKRKQEASGRVDRRKNPRRKAAAEATRKRRQAKY